jgi:hypothetical protein
MGRGFMAMQSPAERPVNRSMGDRTGQVTIHPELLDADGQLTQEDLLTVRFGSNGESSAPRVPPAE